MGYRCPSCHRLIRGGATGNLCDRCLAVREAIVDAMLQTLERPGEGAQK